MGVVLLGAIVGLVIFVVVGRGDDDDKTEDATTETTAAPGASTGENELPSTQQLQLDDVPFTFAYPGNFAPADELPTGYLAILGIDQINFIDVRLTADGELTDEDITGTIGAALETDTTDVLGQSTQTVGDVTFISFEVSDTSGTEPTTSRLNFVRADGRTWELGCQSNAAGDAVIDDACDQMLDTFTLTG